MKMIATTGAAPIDDYAAYVHNCQRNQACEPPYAAPLPGVPYLQLYVDFGQYKPATYELWLQNMCDLGHTEQLIASNYIVGKMPEGGWYGVFKYVTHPLQAVTNFVAWLSVLVDTPGGLVEKTYFSELLQVEACLPLTKIKACYPEGATDTGFDLLDRYYGQPVNNDWLGFYGIRYFHIAYTRLTKARELPPKATFTSNLIRTFRSQVDRTWSLETELVPKWYYLELLAIYLRGALSLNDGPTYLVSDLNAEAINDDDVTWKPFATLKQTTRQFFGCDTSLCVECCSPQVLSATANTTGFVDCGDSSGSSSSESASMSASASDSASASASDGESASASASDSASASASVPHECVSVAIPPFVLPDGEVGVPYDQLIPITGDAPFGLVGIGGAGWMVIVLSGSNVHITGTPDTAETVEVGFTVTNCDDLTALFDQFVTFAPSESSSALPCDPVQFMEGSVPDGEVGAAYSVDLHLTGDAPFTLGSITKPAWMTVTLVGSTIELRGTPDAPGLGETLTIDVGNCDATASDTFTDTIDVSTGAPAIGTVSMDACQDGGASINSVKWNAFDVAVDSGSFPVGPAQSITVSAIGTGTHNLVVNITSSTSGRVRVTDSAGTIPCQTLSVGTANYTFTGFVVTDGFDWTVVVDCGAC